MADQDRQLVALTGQSFEERDQVGDHDFGPVATAGDGVEAGGLAMPPGVRRNDAVVATPALRRVRPAQARVGEAVQQNQGRAVSTPELVHREVEAAAWVSHGPKYGSRGA